MTNMKLQFKIQAHQTEAVQAVIDCFKGQPYIDFTHYQMDAGIGKGSDSFEKGYKNADYVISDLALLENVQAAQRNSGIPISKHLVANHISPINLDIEMETGTGKTYCYIKTIFELNKQYGWTKFIVVVPSIAIREGVAKSFEITADHFYKAYAKKARYFIYQSNKLDELNAFSLDAYIHVMIINIQAFNAKGQEARRIYEECDDFQSRRPIDVISANRPILILDEPQKMGGDKTLKSLEQFKALMVLHYSATHKIQHDQIYRLDAIDAYNKKLVKKIAVCGITVKGLAGTDGYLCLQSIDISTTQSPIAHLEFEQKLSGGHIKRVRRPIKKGDNLFSLSNELEVYRHGYMVSDIDANEGTIYFTNGTLLSCGDSLGHPDELTLRRIQIREAIKAHFDKEQWLFKENIKVLTLFFIDEVAKYRDYSAPDEKGEYARIFEEEYRDRFNKIVSLNKTPYMEYLKNIDVEKTHNGYFSIDKKTKRMVDPDTKKRTNQTDDVSAYDLILKHKERLLSFEEPVRFIFSHSALREGWDNPNVFVICTLKNSDNTISRRQEVGRGLRLCVNQCGERIDVPELVHQVNVLTVVASESYVDFVEGLQNEIADSLGLDRFKRANVNYFFNKTLDTLDGAVRIKEEMANSLHRYLIKNDYIDEKDVLSLAYSEARQQGTLATLPETLQPYADAIFDLVDSVTTGNQLGIVNEQRLKKNALKKENFNQKEFQALWQRINHKASYHIQLDSEALIQKAVSAINTSLHALSRRYVIERGEQQSDEITQEKLCNQATFEKTDSTTETNHSVLMTGLRYDLIDHLTKDTGLKRQTIGHILSTMDSEKFETFQANPEYFIAQVSRLINEQKVTMMIEGLTYHLVDERFDHNVFEINQEQQDLSKAVKNLKKHIYDYLIPDSSIEKNFAKDLDSATEVVVYAKLPTRFYIPTPIGEYHPDWAISFKEGTVKHIYFVAETKGSSSTLDWRDSENKKIDCAKLFFSALAKKYDPKQVRYDVVTNVEELMNLVNQ